MSVMTPAQIKATLEKTSDTVERLSAALYEEQEELEDYEALNKLGAEANKLMEKVRKLEESLRERAERQTDAADNCDDIATELENAANLLGGLGSDEEE